MKIEKILNEKEQTSQIQGLSKMKVVRTAVYARVSTDMDIQKSSLEEQMKSFRAKIDEHPGWVLVDVYADEGISGTRVKHRKAFLRMIKDCEEGNPFLQSTQTDSDAAPPNATRIDSQSRSSCS